MGTKHDFRSLSLKGEFSAIATAGWVCLVVAACYLVPTLEGALIQNPKLIWPLWPGSAVLVSILMLVPGRIWPILIPVAFATFAMYDLGVGVPLRSIIWFLPANTIQILTSALCLRYAFDGIPRLNTLKALAKYSIIAVILAPSCAAFLSAPGIGAANYWQGWRICFLSEALAFATLAPAILSWVSEGPAWLREPRSRHLEALALIVGLVVLSHFAFDTSAGVYSPVLLYAVVPFLLWAALRFRWIGVSTSVILVCIFTIHGAIHNQGPFSEVHAVNMLSLQLFMTFAAIPFMTLAALAEDRELASRGLAGSNERLRESEELLKIFVKSVPVGVAMLDREMRYLQVSDRWCADYSVTGADLIGRSHYEFFSDIPQYWKEVHSRALQGETLRADEDPWDRAGGTTWLRWEIRPWRTSGGTVGGILIFAEDITHRKEMEDAISGMSRKLIQSQEQERARIGRELHDDINQRLAILALDLEQLGDNPSELRSNAQELRKRAMQISDDVQALSHELHSSKLEYLGLIKGMRSWCTEFGERQGLVIDFNSTEVQASVAPHIGLCLFRVLQEALHNASKHSGVKRIDVQLREDSGEIHLRVSDLGRGFDLETANQGRGLGLTSMQERVRLVDGIIEIQSKPMRGTTVHVRVPLGSQTISRAKGRGVA